MDFDAERLAVVSGFIRRRRSIKPVDMDSTREVDRALLSAVLENSNWAPTHGMTEPWRFHVFQEAGRHALAETLQRLYREQTPGAEFREEKMRKLGENPLLSPVIMAIVMERQGGAKVPELEEIEAVACAVQNMHITASAAGLAAYWSSPPIVYTRSFADWLGLGPDDRCLGLFYLGWPKANLKWPESSRKPIADKIVWHCSAE